MFGYLWLEPIIPFASAALLLVFGRRLGRRAAAWLGTGAVAASAVLAIAIALTLVRHPQPAGYTQVLWDWITVGNFQAQAALFLDPLAAVMTVVVALVGFLIHLYSTEFMQESEGYQRFFGYMNLFVASMLTLVLADNLLLLFLGWEGVGLCSYLLIGFWYQNEVNGLAGRKAFIVTRVGDTGMILALFLLFNRLGTLNIQELLRRAATAWPIGAGVSEAAAFLLLLGAVGKSAQLPLQTWLPDAMAGPTPTSALIHAATMVTAGVYLIARTHTLFELAPAAQATVAGIGLATLLLAGCSALAQNDIKRILAYSTISQIGYMFLALGVGAWSAAIFHLATHACFKALLFLAAGVVIQSMHEEHDIFQMGGLRHRLPGAFWCFLIAGASLAGLPLITAGFYSKGLIIYSAWASPMGSAWLWAGALLGALLTALYIFRLIFVVFYGNERRAPEHFPGPRIQWPMAALAFLSIVAGFINLPAAFGGRSTLTNFLTPSLPELSVVHTGLNEWVSELAAAAVFCLGLYLVYLYSLQDPARSDALLASPAGRELRAFWHADWGMDWLYDHLFVQSVIAAAYADRHDAVDQIYAGIAWLSRAANRGLSRTETGQVRRYAGWIVAGAVVLVVLARWRG